jgi:hypothetical protein
MYASDYSTKMIAADEKVSELMTQITHLLKSLNSWKEKALKAETNLAKIYAQREAAQVEMSEMSDALDTTLKALERLIYSVSPWHEGDDCKSRCDHCGAIDDGYSKHKNGCEWDQARAVLDATKELLK